MQTDCGLVRRARSIPTLYTKKDNEIPRDDARRRDRGRTKRLAAEGLAGFHFGTGLTQKNPAGVETGNPDATW